MSMVVTECCTLVAKNGAAIGIGSPIVAYSDPIPLKGAQSVVVGLSVKAMWSDVVASLTVAAEKSMDGVNFITAPEVAPVTRMAVGASIEAGQVSAPFIRLKTTLTVSEAGMAAATFSINVDITPVCC